MDLLIKRVLRAALLDRELYTEVKADPSLNQESLQVVLAVSILSGIGAFFAGLIAGKPAFIALLVYSGIGVGNYYLWAYITHYIGINIFDGAADLSELMRVLGYASAPRILGLLVFIPYIGPVIALVGAIWSLAVGFFCVWEVFKKDTTETLIMVFSGWLAGFIIFWILNLIFGFTGAR